MIQSPNHSITQSPNRSMFWRLWLRSLTVKRPQAALAIVSLLVGAAVASMLLNLYGDVRRKMTQEFRAYGANVVVAPAAAGSTDSGNFVAIMDEDVLGRLEPFLQRATGLVAVPMLYAVARLKRVPGEPRLPEFENVVAAGTDFAALRRVYSGWHVKGLESSLNSRNCVIGAHIAARLHVGVGDAVELEAEVPAAGQGPPDWQAFRIASVVSTGTSEDDQVFVPLRSLQGLAGLEGKISLLELSVPGETAEVKRLATELSQEFGGLEVRPIRQIVYSEGKVLGTIRWLVISLTTLILVIIALCVAVTMTAIVLERRKDIAVMKALGASDRLVMELFLSEGASLGLLGGLVGSVLGGQLARDLGERLFGVTLNLAWWTFPLICASSMLLAVLAALFPVRMVRGVQPAAVLKGE